MLLAVCETLAKSGDLGLHVLDLGLREAAPGEPGCARGFFFYPGCEI